MAFDMNQELASKWMSIQDVPTHGVDLQMLNVTKENVGEMLEDKFALHFNGGFKPLLLNRTNIRIITSLFGADTGRWIGQVINVYNDPTVSYAGRMTGGVRVRAAQMAQHRPQLPAQPAAPVPPPGYGQVPTYANMPATNRPIADLGDDIPF